MSNDVKSLQQEIERLRAQLSVKSQLKCKVSEKGGVSIYGLQRMPVTLYREQWERLLNFGDTIRTFISEHSDMLKLKDAA